MTARDELAQIIQETSNYHTTYYEAGEIADAILAAGWRAPEPKRVYPLPADECEHNGWFSTLR